MNIAIPYYHRLVLPLSGLARLFFIVQVDPAANQAVSCQLATFDPQERSFGDWLDANRVVGLLSGDAPGWLLGELAGRRIWHRQVPAGEPLQIVMCWLRLAGIRERTTDRKRTGGWS